MNTLKDLFIFISRFINNNPICVETGTQYYFEENNLVHTSTSNLLKYIVKPKIGMLYSFDNDEEHIKICESKLETLIGLDYSAYIRFIHGDSAEQLKKIIDDSGDYIKIDLVFLDSKDFDEEHMLNEFKIIESNLSDSCIIMCDDIHNPSSVKYKKAVPYIKEKIDLWFEYNTPTGLFVGIKNSEMLL